MKWLRLALLAFLICGCSDQLLPPRQDALLTDQIAFLHFQPDAFASAEKTARFWAVKGQDRGVALRYGDTGEEYLRFDVGAQSLRKRPNGTYFQDGDSVQITVSVGDDGAMIFSFSPSGLKFSDLHPASLTVNTARSNSLLPGIGLGMWKRELPLLPWLSIPSIQIGDVVSADISSFTDFGMAVN